jgi:hypothetical protein
MLARKSELKSCIKLLQVDSCRDFDMGMHSQSFLSPKEWVRHRKIQQGHKRVVNIRVLYETTDARTDGVLKGILKPIHGALFFQELNSF